MKDEVDELKSLSVNAWFCLNPKRPNSHWLVKCSSVHCFIRPYCFRLVNKKAKAVEFEEGGSEFLAILTRA